MSDHSHRGEYADDRHDHDVDYAEKHHRHYDLEREGERLKALTDLMVKDLRELREDLRGALERIRQLEDRQQDQADESEDESWRSTLADYQVASGAADYDDIDHIPVCCMRTVWVDGRLEQCGEPVDHEPNPACPGNPHARPAAGDFVADPHYDVDAARAAGDDWYPGSEREVNQ